MADFDLAIIGGGINGAGLARDAAGRGLRVLLVEQADLASGTSSASTKLIHGGLRYLEHGAFLLVREALKEREVLLRNAPHIIRPMRFLLPPQSEMRSPLWLRLGLFIYDHLGGRKILPATQVVDLTHNVLGEPLKRAYDFGFLYSDCWVDDARLVVLNALDAAERGATIRTRTKCVRAERSDIWRLVLNTRGASESITARALVNAAGPWVGLVAETVVRVEGPPRVRLVKGSHIVVQRLFDHHTAYIFQNPDRRVVFALPYERDFTLIGTTDENFKGDPAAAAPSAGEIAYLCETASRYFRNPVTPADIVHAFAGVRSLYDDGSKKPEDVTRDYHLDFDKSYGNAPLLTIYGGKITTYRKLAEAAMKKLAHVFEPTRPWTATAPLPGGMFPYNGIDAQVAQLRRRWPFVDEDHALRLVRAYGTRASDGLGEAKRYEDLGQRFGTDLTEAEVRYLMMREWAMDADDVLWRRSKLGLRFSDSERAALQRYMTQHAALKAAE
ncbi:glycerol-3-phosphate dehydrogenase [Pseudorhodoplanes sinuspersici]|uniref:Glycerol-3-phosphate dehydrogenase n=1 Tax=Pseudorhodoplanes sinuspersici TaxID=1235591 RepID=A0A1W6ZM39_9HYPH|nr:glycerol-3-phosphate dehydrogenase [Pseudorhodoplanes sinuspersici]ARP98317.1 glycerol-3-phosphate dehydrogenase [Pseudorhodoplanes sinuspersici]RKE65973.1 homodimeric glycerol 3-phosphate dehydrogenase (quinone) [Pseudorhodoplanes sinuspersici]